MYSYDLWTGMPCTIFSKEHFNLKVKLPSHENLWIDIPSERRASCSSNYCYCRSQGNVHECQNMNHWRALAVFWSNWMCRKWAGVTFSDKEDSTGSKFIKMRISVASHSTTMRESKCLKQLTGVILSQHKLVTMVHCKCICTLMIHIWSKIEKSTAHPQAER